MPAERLKDLLKDKAFVDYFNLFLSQPIFGFRIVYQFYKKKFSVDAQFISNLEEMTVSKLICWVEAERLPLFFQSPMYAEYKFCCELRELEFNTEMFLHTCDHPCQLDKTLVKLIVENVFGHYIGMQEFKQFLCETNGEKACQCIQDVTIYYNQKLNAQLKRYELHHLIMKYLANGALYELSGRLKLHLFLDSDSAEYKSMEDATLVDGICFDNYLFHKETLHTEPDKALERFYFFLLQDMMTYWAPNFVIHLLEQRISYQLNCLCQLSFTEATGTLINIRNLFDFSTKNCPTFLSEEAHNASYFPKDKKPKLSSNIQEYLFGDEHICETFHSMNEHMMNILASDRFAGYPFLQFLLQASKTNGDLVFLLWEDLCKYMNIAKKNSEHVKRLQETKIKKLYLLKERTSEDDLLDDAIKHIALSGFEMADDNEKLKKILKAADMTTNILETLWNNYIAYEKNKMKTAFEHRPSGDVTDEHNSITGSPSGLDTTTMVDIILNCIDISQIKEGVNYSQGVLSCFFDEEEIGDVNTSIRSHSRPYKIGKSVCTILKSPKINYKKRGMPARNLPKPRKAARPYTKDTASTMKFVTDLKNKFKVLTSEPKLREKSMTRHYGINPYLSLRQERIKLLPVSSDMRKKYVFRKYFHRVCQFLHEMLQPYMKDLLIAYVDALQRGGEFKLIKETTPTERRSQSMRKGALKRHITVYKPSPIFFTRMKKKIAFLSDSLQFKRSAYMMLQSSRRTRINMSLKNKARRIIINFQEGGIFSKFPNSFVFSSKMDLTEEIANETVLKLKLEGASCGLFHKLTMHVIPSIYQIWKKMGLACIHCGGRKTFLAALGIKQADFDKKYPTTVKVKGKLAFEKPAKPAKEPKVKKSHLEEQATSMTKSMQKLVDEDGFWKYRRQFPLNIMECFSPDLRKLIQMRGGSQLEYVLIQ